MTTTARLRGCAALFGSCLLLVAAASAETRPINGTFAGTSYGTGVDANGDGEMAAIGTSEGRSNLGPTTTVSRSELVPFDGVSFCGPTHILLQYLYLDFVASFADGSRYFAHTTEGSACINFATGGFTLNLESDIVGGTGRFAGATGQLSIEAHDEHLGSALTVFAGSFEGTLTIP